MKFSIDKKTLQTSLQHLAKGVPNRSTLPILSSVFFDLNQNSLLLRATDLEISLEISLEVDSDDIGKTTIPLKTLLEITSAIPNGNLSFTISEDNKIAIESVFGKYSIMGKPADEFPSSPVIENAKLFNFTSEEFIYFVDSTLFAVSRDELKPALQGVLFQVENDELLAVATDGYRLVKLTKKDIGDSEFKGQVVIPHKFLNTVRSILGSAEKVSLLIGDNYVKLDTDKQLVVSSRIINERYPDFESIIPKDNDKTLMVNKEDILSSVKRVSIFSNKTTKQVSFSISENTIQVSTKDSESITTGNETVECEYKNDPITIGYNSQFLKEILEHQGSDNIQIKLKTPVSAAIFLQENLPENINIVMLLMPIRLND
jgi:DNA polymerase III subunit beta